MEIKKVKYQLWITNNGSGVVHFDHIKKGIWDDRLQLEYKGNTVVYIDKKDLIFKCTQEYDDMKICIFGIK